MVPLALAKYPGGKSLVIDYLYHILEWSECDTLIDGCAGMGSVSLNAPAQFKKIIVNEFDKLVHNLWVHFQNPKLFRLLEEKLLETTRTLETWQKASVIYENSARHTMLDNAWATTVIHRMSRSSMGRKFQMAGRLRRGMNECDSAWLSYQQNLKTLHRATQRVEIRREDVVKLLLDKTLERQNIVWFLDPPYPLNTRTCMMYRMEWSDKKHQKFLNAVRDHRSKVVICGRPNDMYEYNLNSWKVDVRELTNSMNQRKQKLKNPEVVWTNYEWGIYVKKPSKARKW